MLISNIDIVQIKVQTILEANRENDEQTKIE